MLYTTQTKCCIIEQYRGLKTTNATTTNSSKYESERREDILMTGRQSCQQKNLQHFRFRFLAVKRQCKHRDDVLMPEAIKKVFQHFRFRFLAVKRECKHQDDILMPRHPASSELSTTPTIIDSGNITNTNIAARSKIIELFHQYNIGSKI